MGSWSFAYTGNVQTFTVPATGVYKLEVWGAGGGQPMANGAMVASRSTGGYSSGYAFGQGQNGSGTGNSNGVAGGGGGYFGGYTDAGGSDPNNAAGGSGWVGG